MVLCVSGHEIDQERVLQSEQNLEGWMAIPPSSRLDLPWVLGRYLSMEGQFFQN